MVFPPPGFSYGARNQFIGGRVDVIYPDAGEAFLEYRKDFLSVDLRQGPVEVQGAAFLQRFLVKLIHTF